MNIRLVGVDEAGRGPLAGPLSVCALFAEPEVYERFRGVGDSKQLSPKKREEAFATIQSERAAGRVVYGLALIAPARIDREGIAQCLKLGVERALFQLEFAADSVAVLLDGSLKAPLIYIDQQTIIKGDEKEPLIGMASIVAKVLRDRQMVALAKEYPQYGFEIHKGYGTKAHYEALRLHGPSPIHRKTFL